MKFPTFDIEEKYGGSQCVFGVDEAGRGPLAGPVIAAVARYRGTPKLFYSEDKHYTALVRDSKTVSQEKRERVYEWIIDHFDIGIGTCDAETIDRVNILQATFLAMKKAVEKISEEKSLTKETIFLIDGNQEIPSFLFSQRTVISGDALCVSIAAASIVAKVTRDRMMDVFDGEYPQYGFGRHKGYGTREHMEALFRFGPLPIHRHSFAPVARACEKFARNKES